MEQSTLPLGAKALARSVSVEDRMEGELSTDRAPLVLDREAPCTAQTQRPDARSSTRLTPLPVPAAVVPRSLTERESQLVKHLSRLQFVRHHISFSAADH